MTKYPYSVFIEKDDTYLEVEFTKGILTLYSIEDNGSFDKISESKSRFVSKTGAEHYFADVLTNEALMTINLLTSSFDVEEIASKLVVILRPFKEKSYVAEQFSMEMSYAFSDYTEVLRQKGLFTGRSDLMKMAQDSYEFYGKYFYDFHGQLSQQDLLIIEEEIQKQISILNQLKND